MIKTEAIWLRERLLEIAPRTILNCGSSTKRFRTIEQPWIEEALEGFSVTHLDKKRSEGVDIVADLEQETVFWKTIETALKYDPIFDCVLLTSVLEHVNNREAVMGNVSEVIGKYLVVTVPFLWAYHPDPIDTGFRPCLIELVEFVNKFGFTCVKAKALDDSRGKVSAGVFRRLRS